MTQPKRWTEKAHARPVDGSKPDPVPDGYARCDCGKVCKVLKSGRLKMHKTPRGYECSGTVGHRDIPLAVVLAEEADAYAQQEPIGSAPETYKRPRHRVLTRADKAYAAPKGQCRVCGKKLPGERTLCGACGVRLGR